MKKKSFIQTTTTVLLWTITSAIYSREVSSASNTEPEVTLDRYICFSVRSDNKDSILVYLNDISTKALRNFTKTYKDVSDAKWYKFKDGYVAYFSRDGIKYRVYYDLKGSFQSTIRQYGEDKLPFEIRHIVKSTYYDYSIYVVKEVNTMEKTAYLVKLEGKNSWKMVRVLDNEMILVENYIKK